MLRRWTFAQRVGAGLSACLLAGLILLATLVSATHTLAVEDGAFLHHVSDILSGLLGLGALLALVMVLRNALGPMHAERLQSEQRLHLFMDGVSDYALCFLEPDGTVSCWSTGAERLTGWTSSDIVGQRAEVLHVPDAVAHGLPTSHRERPRASGACSRRAGGCARTARASGRRRCSPRCTPRAARCRASRR
ncbi:hypothetical protein [Corallococcus sp. 4LFB]|uniref:hypothetical protein n=1 Tax=Corallococcus sp. 4LFB TaxID=3383249 RepID=UPI003975373F